MTVRRLAPLLLAVAALAAAPPAGPDRATIDRLIAQLGADTYAERQQATEELDRLGGPALEALRNALHSPDAEIRHRAADLVARVGRRVESERLLQPTLVHLTFRDTPLPAALEEFRKKTGHNLVLRDPGGRLTGRRVTLDTGKTSFWSALEKFCAAAGLVEAESGEAGTTEAEAAIREARARQAAEQAAWIARMRARGLVPPGAVMPPVGRPTVPSTISRTLTQLTLVPGKKTRVPVDSTTAVRVRPRNPAHAPVVPPGPGELGLTLEVTHEPRLVWQRLIDVQIDRALDEHGQDLRQVPGSSGTGLSDLYCGVRGLQQLAPVRLQKGEKVSRTLKELSGTMAAQILTGPEPLLVAEDVLTAAGKVFHGRHGGKLAIHTVTRQPEGIVQVSFTFEQPRDTVPVAGPGRGIDPAVQLRIGRVRGGRFRPARGGAVLDRGLTGQGLTFVDDRGNNLPTGLTVNLRGGRTLEYVAVYRPQGDRPASPAKLVYTGRRLVRVILPFHLVDVRLP